MCSTMRQLFVCPSNPIHRSSTNITLISHTRSALKMARRCTSESSSGDANLKSALSSMVGQQVAELLNKEENKALLDALDSASIRVEIAKTKLAEIQKQELELQRFKDYVSQIENRASQIEECQKEIFEARGMIEEAERSLLETEDGGRLDKDEERLESVKAASISAIVGTLAGLPIFLAQATATSQLLLPTAITFFSCALFGLTFRYTIRRDLDNIQLKTGTSAAFAFVKGLATLDGGVPLEFSAQSFSSHALDAVVYFYCVPEASGCGFLKCRHTPTTKIGHLSTTVGTPQPHIYILAVQSFQLFTAAAAAPQEINRSRSKRSSVKNNIRCGIAEASGETAPMGQKTKYNDGAFEKVFMALFARKMEKFANGNKEQTMTRKWWDFVTYDYDRFVDVSKRVMQGRNRMQQQLVVRQVLLSMLPPGAPAQFRKLFPPTKWACEFNASITVPFFQWLVGPSEVVEVEVNGTKQRSGVHIKKCRYLENSGCVGMCVNMCKIPTQDFFTNEFGLPLTMNPNFEDMSCEMIYGQVPPPFEDDPVSNQPCYKDICSMANPSSSLCHKLQA